MKWRSMQVRFTTARRRAVLAAIAVAGLAPAAGAQGGAPAPAADALCRCFVGDDSTGARAGGRGWALLGAAGLALLAGIPVGGAGTAAIPFVEGLPGSPLGPLADVAAAPPPTLAGTVLPVTVAPGVVAPLAVGPLAELPSSGLPPGAFVAPKTATHLPLLAAAGVLLMGGGGLLARRQARRQRRRRRCGLAL